MALSLKKEWVIPTVTGIICFAAGAASGYFLGLRRQKEEVESLDEQIEDMRSQQLQMDFKRLEQDREFNSQIQQAAHVVRELKTEGRKFLDQFVVGEAGTFEPEEDDEKVVSHTDELTLVSVFVDDEEDEWDYEIELAHREGLEPGVPYIIHRDEFFGKEKEDEGYSQTSITYYKGDGILTDELDSPIYQPERVAGDLVFGHGSKDPNICYIRNDRLMAEYEVLLDHGSFQVEVLGADLEDQLPPPDDLRNSILKFRQD